MALLIGFFLTIVLLLVLNPVGHKFGLYDVPAGRKNHQQPILVIGGIGMLLAFYIAVPMLDHLSVAVYCLLAALLLIGAVGMIDDMHQLKSRWLFSAQIAAAMLMIVPGGVLVQDLGDLFGFGLIHTGLLAIPFTLICVLGVINAVNMSDGMDGLAGSLMLISVGWFAVLAFLTQSILLCELLLILLGAIAGFLIFNMRLPWRARASIFMGNAGSMSLGLLLSFFAIELGGKLDSPVPAITAVWIIGLPLIDMARVMVSRIRQGKSAFIGDHIHIHHLLLSAGFCVQHVVAIKTGMSFLLGAIGVLGWYFKVADYHMFHGFVLMSIGYFYATGPGWRHVCHLLELRMHP